MLFFRIKWCKFVSTHSRPKAAGGGIWGYTGDIWGFNTQPPEGGWQIRKTKATTNTVSTHSRPKAAGSPYIPVVSP